MIAKAANILSLLDSRLDDIENAFDRFCDLSYVSAFRADEFDVSPRTSCHELKSRFYGEFQFT